MCSSDLEAGLPPGVFNVVHGDKVAVDRILEHPKIAAVSFVGSTPIAHYIYETGTHHGKRVQALGGAKNHAIIMPDADIDMAVGALMGAAYGSAGERCMAISVAVPVGEKTANALIEKLVPKIEALKVGPASDRSSEMGPLVTRLHRQRVLSYIDAGRDQGAELVVGGGSAVVGGGPSLESDGGYFVEPTVFTATDDSLKVAREEIFGPVLVAIPYESLEEVAARANDTDYGLAAGVWTRSLTNAHRLASLLKAGSVYVNCWGEVDPGAPFGGYKASGVGREHGREGLEAYLETKTVWAKLG